MDDLVNVIVAIAVIYGVYRWFSSPGGNDATRQNGPSLGFRPKRVTPDMVAAVQAAFPDQPNANIHYDLLKTGSVEITCNKILEKGYLEAPPPAYFALHPTQDNPAPPPPQQQQQAQANPRPVQQQQPSKPVNLISRYGLEQRVESDAPTVSDPSVAGGKAVWENSAEKREASLKERKAQMILAARQRMLAKQGTTAGSSSSS